MTINAFLLPGIFILGAWVLISLQTSIRQMNKKHLDHILQNSWTSSFLHFLYKNFPKVHFARLGENSLEYFIYLSLMITLIGYGISGSFYSFRSTYFIWEIIILLAVALFGYFIFQSLAFYRKEVVLKLFSPIATIYLFILYPITYPVLWCSLKMFRDKKDSSSPVFLASLKNYLLEISQELEWEKNLDKKDLRLLNAVAHFGEITAREIMRPRINIVSISSDATVFDALKLFSEEGYSRLPVYKDNIDNIVGMLLYKDIINKIFTQLENTSMQLKTTSITSFITPVLYVPEGKKISLLFPEMRAKKIHLSIVVNEYGATEGLITIEDIIEDLIGIEILDEHDEDENEFLQTEKDASWIVDPQMSIIDAEKHFGIQIPHSPEYETLSGFITAKTGVIPQPGTVIIIDTFRVEILASDERQIHKIRIQLNKDS